MDASYNDGGYNQDSSSQAYYDTSYGEYNGDTSSMTQQAAYSGGSGEEWSQAYDEASSSYYWYNSSTGETKWA